MCKPKDSSPLNTLESRVYTVADIMKMFKVCRNTVYNYIKRYGWKTYRWGNDIRIDKDSFEEWLRVQSKTKGE